MAFLSQHRFPRLWLLFQNTIGGNIDKQALYKKYIKNPQRILEIGCSAGNTTSAFIQSPSLESYIGIDIDKQAIQLAKTRFQKHPRVSFYNTFVQEFSRASEFKEFFDLIAIAGMAHHQPDDVMVKILNTCSPLLRENGKILLIDPLKASPTDGWFIHFCLKYLEQGRFLRTPQELHTLLEKTPLTVQQVHIDKIGSTPWSWPHCGNFITMELIKSQPR